MSPSWKFITPPWLCCRLDPTQQGNDKCCATEFVYQPGSEKRSNKSMNQSKNHQPNYVLIYLSIRQMSCSFWCWYVLQDPHFFLHHNHFCGVDSTLQNSSNLSRNPFVNSISSFSKHSNIYWHAFKIDPAYIGNPGPVTKLLPTLKRNVDSSVMSCRLNANSLTQKASSLTPMNIDAAACQNF